MKNDLEIKNGISIPEHELEITTSRAGGPGGQHVNKSETRVTVRWNVKNTSVLTDEQKERVLKNLAHRLTSDGDLLIHSSALRSQQQNKQNALHLLVQEVKKALYVPKKRMKTKVSAAAQATRLHQKSQRSSLKKLRSKKIGYE